MLDFIAREIARGKAIYHKLTLMRGLFYWWNMNITLGDTIKIDGEEVPEYLLKALYENLKEKYAHLITSGSIVGGRIQANSLLAPHIDHSLHCK